MRSVRRLPRCRRPPSAYEQPGWPPYEVSNWAKPGFECRHNLGYWERRPYLGLGAGAHSYRDDHRWWNVRPPEEYLSLVESGRLPIGGDELLELSDAHVEEVFLRCASSKCAVLVVEDERSAPFVASRLLVKNDGALVPTERGMLVLNELVMAVVG